MNSKHKIFIDFDGTITANDVGYEMFRRFTNGRTQPVVDKYRSGEVNSHTCLKIECDIWNSFPPDQNDVSIFLKQQKLTPGFEEFIRILKDYNIRPIVLSEGFDFYIDSILNTNGLADLEKIYNKAAYRKGKIMPEFPYRGRGCGECSNCKGYHVRRMTDPKAASVFIGDGHSDIHGAAAADIVFARSFLKETLEKTGRNYFEYTDFYDIIKTWREISSRKIFSFSERLRFCSVSAERRGDFERLWEMGRVMKNVGYPEGLGRNRQQYKNFWETLDIKNFVLFAIEKKDGRFMGEAKLSFPDTENTCSHDVKLLPKYQGQGYGREAWDLLMELSYRRWPDSRLKVTPSVDNAAAIKLYESLGFESENGIREWIPSSDISGAVRVKYLKMIRSEGAKK